MLNKMWVGGCNKDRAWEGGSGGSKRVAGEEGDGAVRSHWVAAGGGRWKARMSRLRQRAGISQCTEKGRPGKEPKPRAQRIDLQWDLH